MIRGSVQIMFYDCFCFFFIVRLGVFIIGFRVGVKVFFFGWVSGYGWLSQQGSRLFFWFGLVRFFQFSRQVLVYFQVGCFIYFLSLKRIRWLCFRMVMRVLGLYSVGLRKVRFSGSFCIVSSFGFLSSFSQGSGITLVFFRVSFVGRGSRRGFSMSGQLGWGCGLR